MALTDNAKGALLMSASMAGFVLNDTMMKSLSGEVPLFQAILVRGLFASSVILILAWQSGALRFRPGPRDRRLIGLRMISEAMTTCFFLTALFNMPLANSVAILQAASLGVPLCAALFLGDKVGWRRYLAIIIGFCGVLLIVRPGGEGFNIYSLSALAATSFVVLRDLVTRQISRAVPGLGVTVLTSLTITALGAVGTLISGYVTLSWEAIGILAASSGFLLVGYYAGVEAMRVGEVGAVSPFRYTNLIWALILGLLVFGDLPDPLTILGAVIIVVSGLYTLHRQRVRKGT